jgi:hypothetical protein
MPCDGRVALSVHDAGASARATAVRRRSRPEADMAATLRKLRRVRHARIDVFDVVFNFATLFVDTLFNCPSFRLLKPN